MIVTLPHRSVQNYIHLHLVIFRIKWVLQLDLSAELKPWKGSSCAPSNQSDG